MRAWRLYGRRALGAQLLLGGVEERRREPERDAAADDDELEVEQVHSDATPRPTRRPVRCMIS